MFRAWSLGALAMLATPLVAQQHPQPTAKPAVSPVRPATLRLTVALVGPNLSVQPVPLHELRMERAGGAAQTIRTALDGKLEQAVPAGRIHLESTGPVEANGIRA